MLVINKNQQTKMLLDIDNARKTLKIKFSQIVKIKNNE